MGKVNNFDEYVKESLLDELGTDAKVKTGKKPKPGELVFTMQKPGSPQHVEVRVDPDLEDCYSVQFKNKKDEIKRKSTIISKDLPQWTKKLEGEGWKKDEPKKVTK